MKGQGADTYKEIRTFRYPNMIVKVHIPDLDEEERGKRMKRIHDSSASLLRAEMRIKKES